MLCNFSTLIDGNQAYIANETLFPYHHPTPVSVLRTRWGLQVWSQLKSDSKTLSQKSKWSPMPLQNILLTYGLLSHVVFLETYQHLYILLLWGTNSEEGQISYTNLIKTGFFLNIRAQSKRCLTSPSNIQLPKSLNSKKTQLTFTMNKSWRSAYAATFTQLSNPLMTI